MADLTLLPVSQIKESHDLTIASGDLPSAGMTGVVVPYGAMSVGDKVTFLWQGYSDEGLEEPLFSSPVTLAVEDLGKPLLFTIPRSKVLGIPDGHADIGYRIDYATASGVTSTSSMQTLRIDAPSQTLLAPPKIAGESGDTLDPSKFPAGLIVKLDALYPTAAVGDDLVLYAKGSTPALSLIKTLRVDVSNIDSGAVQFHFEHAWLASNVGAQLQFVYQYARAGEAQTSEPLGMTVRSPLILPQPVVEQATADGQGGGVLFAFNATDGVYINLPAALTLGPDDKVQMHWQGHLNNGQFIATQPVPGTDGQFFIPAAYVAANMGDDAKRFPVFYRVNQQGSVEQDSEPFMLRVEPLDHAAYPTIQCQQAGNGELSFAAVPVGGADLSLAKWAYMAQGQLLTLKATGPAASGATEIIIRDRVPVTAQEASATTIKALLSRAFLNTLKRDQKFTLLAFVSFDGGGTLTAFDPTDITLVN